MVKLFEDYQLVLIEQDESTQCHYFNKVFLVVLGNAAEDSDPINNSDATSRMGMLGFTFTKRPKILVPIMAPILAINRCTPEEVARR